MTEWCWHEHYGESPFLFYKAVTGLCWHMEVMPRTQLRGLQPTNLLSQEYYGLNTKIGWGKGRNMPIYLVGNWGLGKSENVTKAWWSESPGISSILSSLQEYFSWYSFLLLRDQHQDYSFADCERKPDKILQKFISSNFIFSNSAFSHTLIIQLI